MSDIFLDNRYLAYQCTLQITMDRKDDPPKFKVLLIGPSGVGKTSLLMKFVSGKFSYDYQVTTGIEFFSREVELNEKTSVSLQLWDTMGQEAFKSIVKSHYKNVAAVLFIYSIEKRESYDKLGMWVKEVKENVHEQTMFFVLGTKLDLQDVRKVPREDGEAYSKSIKAHSFSEISSKTGENVKEFFDKLCKQLFKKYQSSKVFKELVKPTMFAKTQSFRLRQVDGLRRPPETKKNCC